MTFKFTPKPWYVVQKRTLNGYEFSIDSPSSLLTIATVYGSTNPLWDFVPSAREGKANAYLIAAAPDMYAALKYYRDYCSGAEPSISAFHRMLDEALAKADGETQ